MMNVNTLILTTVCYFLFFSDNYLISQIEIEQDSTVSIGTKFTSNAYLKVQAINKTTGIYLRSLYSPEIMSTKYGFVNKLTIGSTDEYRGILTEMETLGITPNKKWGLFNNINGGANVNSIGTYNWIRNYGSIAYGTLNKIGPTATTGNFSVGTFNISISDDNTFKFGMRNYLLGSAAAAYGLHNVVNTAAINNSFGIFNFVYQHNSNAIYGTRSNIVTSPTGTKPAYGTFNYIFDKNNQTVYGNYSLIIPESTVTGGTKYGSFNEIKNGGNPSIVYGVYSDINNQPGYAGYFDGQLFTSDNTLTKSDRRFKENIRPQEDNLQIILRLHPRKYNLKTGAKEKHGFEKIGFIAQEVQKVLPNIVFEITPPKKDELILENPSTTLNDDEDHLTSISATYYKNRLQEHSAPFLALQYDGFIPIIVGAIQEQQKEIKEYEKMHKIVRQYEESLIKTNRELQESISTIDDIKVLIHTLTNNK